MEGKELKRVAECRDCRHREIEDNLIPSGGSNNPSCPVCGHRNAMLTLGSNEWIWVKSASATVLTTGALTLFLHDNDVRVVTTNGVRSFPSYHDACVWIRENLSDKALDEATIYNCRGDRNTLNGR